MAKLGQHFLVNKRAAQRIASEAFGKVLEIGGGRGALTSLLLSRANELYVVEKDSKLASFLREHFKDAKVIEADFLELKPFEVDVVVGNIPYYISSKILFKLYEWEFKKAVLMFQKEFVQKMTAKQGTKQFGRLSINAQDRYFIEKLFCLKPSSFRPKPKVESCVVKLVKKKRELEGAEEVIDLLFSQKNKKVKNILGMAMQGEMWEKRPWQLSKEEIKRIASIYANNRVAPKKNKR